MRKIFLLLYSIILGSCIYSQELELTIYNQNLGLVKDKRKIEIGKGEQKIEFTDIAAQIDPTSVHFKSLTAPDKCYVLEQNFEYDLINREKLLQKYIGQEIELERRFGKDNEKKEVVKGILLSTSGGLTIKSGEKILVNPSGEISLSKLPEGLILKPTLTWLLQNDFPGEHKIEVNYLTNGINWTADYVIVTDKKDKNIDLTGWITIDNKSGATYKNAKLKLIAGDINRITQYDTLKKDFYETKITALAQAPQFEEKTFFEYHMYTLQRKTTIRDNETKQIEFISKSDIPVKKLYIYDGSKLKFYGYQEWIRTDKNYGSQSNKKVAIMFEFKNSKENNLGLPLPKGRIRVYKEDTDNLLEFIGEDSIEHTPKDEEIRIYLGDAFDIIGDRKQIDFRSGNDWCEESFKIAIRNHKEEQVEVCVIEKLYRWKNWKIINKSHDYEKKDSRTIEFKITVDKNSETVITYTVKYWWD